MGRRGSSKEQKWAGDACAFLLSALKGRPIVTSAASVKGTDDEAHAKSDT